MTSIAFLSNFRCHDSDHTIVVQREFHVARLSRTVYKREFSIAKIVQFPLSCFP